MKYKFQLGGTFSKLGGYLEFVLNWTQWPGWFGLKETRILNGKEAARKYKVSGNRQVFKLLIEIFQGFGRILMVTGFLSEILVGLHIESSSYEKLLLLLKSWVVSLEPILQEKKNIILFNYGNNELFFSISSVAQSCLTPCNPMNRSTPGLPVHHQLLEFTQTHVHGVSDAIQPSHPLLSPSPPAPNPSQHQSLFQWVNSLHEVAKVLEFQL